VSYSINALGCCAQPNETFCRALKSAPESQVAIK
jgi:hypothetical protein